MSKRVNSIQKGKRGERSFAALLCSLGVQARRGVQYAGGPDSPDIVSDLPVHWEVKNTERLNLDKAIAQAKKDANGKDWAVAHKKNNSDWVIVCDAKLFIELYKFCSEYDGF